ALHCGLVILFFFSPSPPRRPPTATPPLQPGEFRPSSSPAPLPSSCPCADHCESPPSRHRVPVAPPRRPVAPLRSHRDASPARRRRPQNHRNSRIAAASCCLSPPRAAPLLRCSALRTHRRAHCTPRPHLRNISGDATAPPQIASAIYFPKPRAAPFPLLLPQTRAAIYPNSTSSPNPITLIPPFSPVNPFKPSKSLFTKQGF
ncbi:hypothetical protein U1Q18_004915, partial [Sarracenia purpurea var. burkii]